MMTVKEKIERASAAVAFDGIYKYIKKNPEENLVKLIDLAQKLMGGAFPEKNFDEKSGSNCRRHDGDSKICR